MYEISGVAAPTLYHHFGDKDGLLAAVVDDAFASYLHHKRSLPNSGDLLSDFATGWDMHIRFGVENPLLYRLMYSMVGAGRSDAAREAENQVRAALSRLATEGLLTMSVDEAVDLTTAMAIGCVTQLYRTGGSPQHPLAKAMRSNLLHRLTGQCESDTDASAAARTLLTRIDPESPLLTPAEHGLLRQWLRALAHRPGPPRRARAR